jgi:superfamily II DNA helicase RecQ
MDLLRPHRLGLEFMDDLADILRTHFGHAAFRPGQLEVMRPLMEGRWRQVFVLSSSGVGA